MIFRACVLTDGCWFKDHCMINRWIERKSMNSPVSLSEPSNLEKETIANVVLFHEF